MQEENETKQDLVRINVIFSQLLCELTQGSGTKRAVRKATDVTGHAFSSFYSLFHTKSGKILHSM